MTFEEFFKKKKIDLDALRAAEPDLFLEFETHYAEMGEKSFDHTKKYWFNKLRLRFPPAAEIKTEKVHIENRLAEQTITEDLVEQSALPAPSNVGFKPRFKANITKPAIEEKIADQQEFISATQKQTAPEPPKPDEAIADKPAYKPKFNMKNVKPKTEE